MDDLKSAINFVKDKGYSTMGLQGDSLGGLVSILSYNSEIKAMVLWAPVTYKKVSGVLKKEGAKKELEEKGYVLKEKDGRTFKFPKSYFDIRENINQEKCPSRSQ